MELYQKKKTHYLPFHKIQHNYQKVTKASNSSPPLIYLFVYLYLLQQIWGHTWTSKPKND